MVKELTISEKVSKVSIDIRFIGDAFKDVAFAVQEQIRGIVDYLNSMNSFKKNLSEYKKATHIYNQTKSKRIKKKQLKKIEIILGLKFKLKGV